MSHVDAAPAVDTEAAQRQIGGVLHMASGHALITQTHLWLPNCKLDCVPPLIDLDTTRVAEITPAVLYAQLQAFRHQFATALAVLAQHYGEGHVSYRWGIIH